MKIRIDKTIEEFQKFIDFIEGERPVLSPRLGVIGKKDSYELNQLLYYKKDARGPYYTQDQYPIIDLMFLLATLGGLYVRANNEKGKLSLVETEAMTSFRTLNNYEKYVYLLQSYWTKYDFERKLSIQITGYVIYNMLAVIANSEKGQKIVKDEHDQLRTFYSYDANFFHHLRFFGFGEIEPIEGAKGKYEDSVKSFIPNELGIRSCRFLINQTLELWSDFDYLCHPHEEEEIPQNKNVVNAFDVFKDILPGEAVMRTVDPGDGFNRSGVYTFRVSLFKDCWREISMSHRHSLTHLHNAIQEAFNFDDDHLYAFYIDGTPKTGRPIFCDYIKDHGKTTAEVSLEDMELYKGQRLYYIFDFGDGWEFKIEVIDIDRKKPLPLEPVIIGEEGEAPDQDTSWPIGIRMY